MSNIKYEPIQIGNIYGRLKVINFDRTEYTKSGQKIEYWLCECQCKNKTIKSIRGDSLKQGKTHSCGCLQKEIASDINVKNLIGKRFNKLTVVSRAKNKGKSAAWNCHCDCGKDTVVTTNSLISNRTKSCGCLVKETSKEIGKRNFLNLESHKFGRLLVLNVYGKSKSGNYLWECLCDCGNITIVSSTNLMSGNTLSCGCLSKELTSKRSLIDLTDNKYGKLTVIKRDIDHILPNGAHATMWRCKCDCGNQCVVYGCSLTSHNTQSCGCITSVGENYISTYLKDKHIFFTNQYSDIHCKNKKCLRFDFAIFEDIKKTKLKYLIEYDGEQHFYPVRFNGMTEEQSINSFKDSKLRDKIKNKYCKDNNVTLIRIPYWDINNIENILDDYIKL